MDDEERLVRKAKAGDREALSVLLMDAECRAKRWLPSKLKLQRADLQDVLQNAHATAQERLSKFKYRYPGSFANWYGAIAKREAYASMRARRIKTGVDLPDPSISPESGSLASAVKKLLEMFSETTRFILDQISVRGDTQKEVGKKLGLTRGKVQRKLRNAQEKLEHRPNPRCK